MKRKILMMIFLIMIVLLLLTPNTHAALESKPGTSPWVNVTISDSFAHSYNLRAGTTTLGNNTLDPHLMTQTDWGIVAYIATSMYGSNGVKEAMLTSTTGNESGIKDFGKTATYVSWFVDEDYYRSRNFGWNSNVLTQRNTKYVSTLPKGENDQYLGSRGWATYEVKGFPLYGKGSGMTYVTFAPHVGDARYGFFGCAELGTWYGQSGQANASVTFRPAIWN